MTSDNKKATTMFSAQGATPDFSFPILQNPTADDLWLAYLSDDILAGEITADDALTLMFKTAPTATIFRLTRRNTARD